jgi:tetratricopeptide (TPR) repeat protein
VPAAAPRTAPAAALVPAPGAPPAAAAPAPAPAPRTAPGVAPAPSVAAAPANPTPAAALDVSDADLALRDGCDKAQAKGQLRRILQACGALFAAAPSAPLATRIAQTAYEQGKRAEALDWSRRAVARDPAFADAYVILGGAEQLGGRTAEAKAAYETYLRLAPQGRHADDLRAVLQGL